MGNELILPENYKQTYDKIVKMIETAKHKVFETANFQTVYLFWHIGQELKDNILNEMWVHSPPLGAQANFNRIEKHDTM